MLINKQKFGDGVYKMKTINQINIKTRTYYFYDDIIDLEDFDSSLLKLDKKII